MAVQDAGLKGGGGDAGRRACNDLGRKRHGPSPVGVKGRQGRRHQGRRQRRRQEGLRRRRPPAPRCLSPRGPGPSTTSTSRAAAAMTAGGPATTSAASDTAPLLEGARAVHDVDLMGGGGYDGRRACDDVGRQRHGAPPVGGEGRRRRGPQGRRRRQRQEGLRQRRPPAPRRLSRRGRGPSRMSASRAPAATTEGGPETTSAASATAPLP